MKRTITEIFIEVEEIVSVKLREDSFETRVAGEEFIVADDNAPQICSICRRAISDFCETTLEGEGGG